ncbi:MAG TPA: NAD(P)/FAD-dependent oxidoreductase [Candidatus Butyricicoccus stercorigallinarum]|nr:NAD(P)/FAD-dependent oxidoreductase [Candidatus Butyricicoccus stercorigallinarum]
MYDVTIIGCGVVGASLAYTLSQYDLKVLVLERENDIAMGTTKANSAIVHAGYDPEPGTLIAELNVRGSAMMEDLCRSLDVKYKRIGSFVLAFDEESRRHLDKLYDNGVKNGVPDMRILTGDEARAMDPNLSQEACAALYAPSAAIIDPWGLCIAQAEVAVRNGVTVKLRSQVTGLETRGDGLLLHTTSGDYETRYAVNCAGGWGHEICALTGESEWEAKPSRGEYYLLDKSSGDLVKHVIFQCPTAAGKGVLVAPTVHGNLIVGPSADPAESPYSRETTLAGLDAVAAASRKSVNGIDLRQSIRNFAGVRAITSDPDFIIRPAKACARLLHVAGIKSPGLSAAPAIAEYARDRLADMGVALHKKAEWDGARTQVRFKELSQAEKAELIARNPRYGRVICRCETITEGEIVAAIHSPIPPCSIDGVKRRAGAGMGRCQGGFCGPRVLDILTRELGQSPLDILQDGDGTTLLIGETKGGAKA